MRELERQQKEVNKMKKMQSARHWYFVQVEASQMEGSPVEIRTCRVCVFSVVLFLFFRGVSSPVLHVGCVARGDFL